MVIAEAKEVKTPLRVRFNNKKDKDFISELRSRVDNYFTQNNIPKHANRAMVIKTVILFAFTYGAFALILFAHFPVWATLCLYMAMGVGSAGIGFNVGHDALHGSYSDNRAVNTWLGYCFNIIGANDYLWKIKHNIRHHTYTNIYHHDDDVAVSGILRFSPGAPLKPIHRIQHYTAFAAYGFLSLFWILFLDYSKWMKYGGNGNPDPSVPHPKKELFRLISFKFTYFLTMFALPWAMGLSWGVIIGGFLLMHAVFGLVLSTVFQLAHIVEGTEHPEPSDELFIDNAWAVHQLQTTADFSVNSKVVTWFTGGLNYQVEHHLFPNICSIHYPEIQKIVEATADEYNLPYHLNKTFIGAIKSHIRTLKKLGTQEKL